MSDKPDTHTILLTEILDQQAETRQDIRNLESKVNDLSAKYESLRAKAITWSSIAASIPIALTHWPKLVKFFSDNT